MKHNIILNKIIYFFLFAINYKNNHSTILNYLFKIEICINNRIL